MPKRRTISVSKETDCPYLDGKKLKPEFIKATSGEDLANLNSLLVPFGFNRYETYLQRTACQDCSACVPLRVRAGEFEPSANMRRSVLRKNRDLQVRFVDPAQAGDYYDLFRKYNAARHANGPLENMTRQRLQKKILMSSGVMELVDRSGAVIGVSVFDRLDASCSKDKGLSGLYTMYDPALSKSRSLGIFAVIKLIEKTKQEGLPYTYLGPWVNGNNKMAYKARFKPLEALTKDGWVLFDPQKAVEGGRPDVQDELNYL